VAGTLGKILRRINKKKDPRARKVYFLFGNIKIFNRRIIKMSLSFFRYPFLLFLATILIQCNNSNIQTGSLVAKGSNQGWVIRNPSKSDLPSGFVIYGNNTYISGNPFFSQFSHDGKTWENINLNTGTLTPSYRVSGGIVFGNNKFVAASCPNIFTSTDGSSWKIKSDSSKYFRSIAFGNNTFVIVGSEGFVLTSRDGETWERHDVDTTISFGSIAFGNNQFVATCEAPEQIMASKDGITWSDPFSIDEHGIEISVIFGNGLFLVAGPQNYMSTDGQTWSLMDNGLGENVFFLNNQFVSLGYSSDFPVQKIVVSQDLESRTEIKTDLPLKDPLLTYINGQYVALDRQTGFAYASKDLSHWTVPNAITSMPLRDVAFGNGMFIAVGDSGTILCSPTCSTWTLTTALTPKNLNAIVFNCNSFISVGDAGTILSSKDGKSWTKVNSGTTSDLNSICFENDLFVAVSYVTSGPILASKDGVTWAHCKTGANDYQRLICGKGKFVIVGINTVFVSIDGKLWEKAIAGNGEFKQSYFDGTRFTITGYDYETRESICLTSKDGTWWERSKPIVTTKKETVPYGAGKCEIVDHRLFWRSSDTSLFEISSQSFYPASVCYGNGRFVGVGDHGRIATLVARYEPGERTKRNSEPPKKIEAFARKMFVCEMDHQYVFLMTLMSDGEKVTGDYRYLRQSKSLRLEGSIDAHSVIRLKEFIDNGKNTGGFVGRISGAEFIGEWRTPDSSKQLYFDGHESSDEQTAAQLKAFRSAYGKCAGTYAVTSISGASGANTMYDCNLENGKWSCSGSSINQGYREPLDGYEPEFDLSIVNKIKLEIKPDLSMELTVNGHKRMNLPAMENKLVYFGGSTTIAKNIKIRELDPSGNAGTYVFTCSKDLQSFSLEGNPTFTFTKIQN
jgi:photosystem II stability/assembly factor-like uncharacterized protein